MNAAFPTPNPTRHQPRILLVDDDEDARVLSRMRLTRAGYSVDTVVDGEAAWAALLAMPYDLLITDQNMPGLHGLDLVARVREAGMTLSVIVDSNCPELGVAEDYPRLGIAAILPKPLPVELVKTVQRILPLPDGPSATRGDGGASGGLRDKGERNDRRRDIWNTPCLTMI